MKLSAESSYCKIHNKCVMSCIFTLICLIGMTNIRLHAQVIKSGTTAASFLKIGIGSRAAAMGESFVAISDDATAVFWNPAGISQLRRSTAFFGHVEWLADMSYENVSIVTPLGTNSAVAIWANSLSVPEDIVRTVFQPEGTGERFSANMISLGATYSRYLTDRFSFGGSVKYVRESIWTMQAAAIAIDVGTLYKSDYRNMKIGISLSNFGAKMKMAGRANLLFVDPDPSIVGNNDKIRAELQLDEWELPLLLRAGVAFNLIESEISRFTLAANQNFPSDNKEFFNFGGEYALNETVFVRGGFRGAGIDEAEGGISFGGGVNINLAGNTSLMVDYAYTDWGILNKVNRFSLSANF